MLEKQIEKKICDYAKSQDFLAYKFTSPNRASVPDRLFISPTGRMFFIEFKAKGKKPTPGQNREILRIRQKGATVFIVDNVEYGMEIINNILVGTL